MSRSLFQRHSELFLKTTTYKSFAKYATITSEAPPNTYHIVYDVFFRTACSTHPSTPFYGSITFFTLLHFFSLSSPYLSRFFHVTCVFFIHFPSFVKEGHGALPAVHNQEQPQFPTDYRVAPPEFVDNWMTTLV